MVIYLQIFAISGRAQHGKDTAAEILSAQLRSRNHDVAVLHYADPLKLCLCSLGWDGEKDELGRELLQQSADRIRIKEPNFLINFMLSFINLFEDDFDFLIIPDARFPDEISRLKEGGCAVHHIHVFRPNYTSPLTERQKTHFSEHALDRVLPDHIIINNGSIECLTSSVCHYLNKIGL